jgi:hypothetical protein
MKAKTASQLRTAARRELAGLGPVIEGSLCASRRGGAIRWQLTDRPAGKTRTLYVPAERAAEVRQWTANWKQGKGLLRALSDVSRQELRGAAGHAAGAARRLPTAGRSRQS